MSAKEIQELVRQAEEECWKGVDNNEGDQIFLQRMRRIHKLRIDLTKARIAELPRGE